MKILPLDGAWTLRKSSDSRDIPATVPGCVHLDLLRAGGSADPLELIGRAGVDLTDPRAFTDVFALFRERLAEFRGLLAPAS